GDGGRSTRQLPEDPKARPRPAQLHDRQQPAPVPDEPAADRHDVWHPDRAALCRVPGHLLLELGHDRTPARPSVVRIAVMARQGRGRWLTLALGVFRQRAPTLSRSGRAPERAGFARAVLTLALLLLLASPTLAEEQIPRAHLEGTLYDFGTVKTGAKVQYTIPLQNLGATDLVIQDLRLSVPALTVR